MTSDELLIERDDPILRVTFNRPKQHNAMTWLMYERLVEACELADASASLRVMLLTGAGERAFVSGTDISQFDTFATGEDGIAYERRIGDVLDRLRRVTIPTVARVQGYCIGGGLALAATCDLRVVSRDAQFGVPVARTLGNCLSSSTLSLLVAHFGTGRVLDLVLRARLLGATEAAATGFVSELCDPEVLDARTEDVVRTLLDNAPLTMWAAKESVRRLGAGEPTDDDIIARVYASNDFRAGVAAFKSHEPVEWTGS